MIVSFSTAGLDALAVRIGGASVVVTELAQAVTLGAARDVVRVAQALVSVHTGELRDHIGFDLHPGGLSASVGPPALLENSDGRVTAYPGFLERGTRPHRIEPRDAKALFWEAPPRKGWEPGHPLPGVNHPGTRPAPYMEPAGDHVWPVYAAALRRAGFAAWESI